MKYIFTGLMLYLLASTAIAADITGNVEHLYVASYGTVFFRIEGDCKTSGYWTFTLGTVGNYSHAWYAMLLAAGTSGKPVTITHSSSCSSTSHQAVTAVRQTF